MTGWKKVGKRAALLAVVTAILLLGGCGSGKGKGDASSRVSEMPLIVEGGELDYDAQNREPAGEIQGADGYSLQESIQKSRVSEEEWDKALEPFKELLVLRVQDPSFSFEGKDEFEFLDAMYRDEQGYTYVLADKSILLLAPDGSVKGRKDYGNLDSGITIGTPIVSDVGEIIFPISDFEARTVDIVCFDRETGAERVLGQMEDRYFRDPLCALRGSKLFYRSNDWIVSWDLATGERTQFFDLKNVGTGDRDVVMGFYEEGIPVLYIGGEVSLFQYTNNSGEELLAVLGTQPPRTELTIRVNDLLGTWDNGFVASAAGAYQVSRQDIHLDYQAVSDDGDREAYRTRAMAEIVSGKSADILCVNRSDFYTLWQKGVIADMDGILSQDTMDALLPGAKELCMIDGKMAGIVPLVYSLALGTSGQDWDGDSWTMREFMEQTEKQGKKYAWVGPNGDGISSTADIILDFAGIPSLESMGLIDYRNHVASLDSGEYRELLEFCKAYGMTGDLSEDAYEICRKERESMATIYPFLYSFSYYEMFYRVYGEQDCRVIGFPGEGGSYNYLNSVKWLVVSKKAAEDPQKREEISAFLEYLLSEEGQKGDKWYLGVRRPTEENCYEIEYEHVGNYRQKQVVFQGQADFANIIKPDDTTYLKEFMEFLENCKGMPYIYSGLEQIIREEADLFFRGEQSAEDTARVTQNRVQLYLEETR